MKVHAYDKTINDIFSPTSTKYIVPRFQREYSWKKEEVLELWSDILVNIKTIDGKYSWNEYFIGSLVLVGDEDKASNIKEFLIVDGQQRLTTITVMMSALVQSFKDLGEEGIARGLYAFIEGRNMDNEPIYKLINETPKPFFQKSIQNYDQESGNSKTDEEKRLKRAYDIIIDEITELKKECDGGDFLSYLKAIRDQILNLKTIFITVDTEEDAYTIFETLNARGINLDAIDLIKNQLFKTLNYDHPDDDARELWKNIKTNLKDRDSNIELSKFYRHFWISKYEFSRDKKLYSSFKKLIDLNTSNIDKNQDVAKQFLQEMVNESMNYVIVTSPTESDWKLQEEKNAYKSLVALSLFKSQQVNTLLIALYDQYKHKYIKITDFTDALQYLENFHFIFSSISSQRTSRLETKYSKYARSLRQSKTKAQSKKIIDEMKNDFNTKLPDYNSFLGGFHEKWFTNNKDKDKKVIQYIFKKWENYLQPTEELDLYKITLEHISPQSSQENKEIGKIGNLLPIASEINNEADISKYQEKIKIFKKSQLEIVKEFIIKYGTLSDWTDEDINKRTEDMAKIAYYDIWKIQ